LCLFGLVQSLKLREHEKDDQWLVTKTLYLMEVCLLVLGRRNGREVGNLAPGEL
jgi:hypothetical protein